MTPHEILEKLAAQLGITPTWAQPSVSAEAVVTGTEEQILEAALDTIWRYKELEY